MLICYFKQHFTCATCTGTIKTASLIQVLDRSQWTEPMRAAIDRLLFKLHGAEGLLKRVDVDYAAMVQRVCTDPNSLHHLTTCQHISSSWMLATVSVSVTTLPPATLSQATVEKTVTEILEKKQQQQKKMTRNCLACDQLKPRYLGDGSSICFF